MPSRIYNNVEGHRLLDGGRVAEDVTSVTLPTITHPTTTINSSGMVADIDMPNTTHVDAMDFEVAHNNGVNCKYLSNPGKHIMEFRIVRQRYNVPGGQIEHESVKYRVTGVHKSTEKGKVETGNPLGATEKYSVLRFEEIIGGTTTTLIDAMAGILKFNGRDYANVIENMLK